jgi:hypothetical protein
MVKLFSPVCVTLLGLVATWRRAGGVLPAAIPDLKDSDAHLVTSLHWYVAGGFHDEEDFNYDLTTYEWSRPVPAASHVVRVVAGIAVAMHGHSFLPLYDARPTPMLWSFELTRNVPSGSLHPSGLISTVNRQVGALDMTMMALHTKSNVEDVGELYSGEQLVMWHGAIDTVDTRRADGSILVDEGEVSYNARLEVTGRSYADSTGAVPWIRIRARSFVRVCFEH